MDRGFYFKETEGLFNKNTSERVSSNLGHRSPDGWLMMIVYFYCILGFVFVKENGHK